MFIHNFTNDVLKYDSKGSIIKLKPNTITFVDDKLVKPEKLKECFGTRIDIRKDLDILGHINGLGNMEDSMEEATVSVEVEESKEESHDVEKEGTEEDSEAQGPKPDNAEEPKEVKEVKEPKEEKKTTKKATSKGGKKGRPAKKKN